MKRVPLALVAAVLCAALGGCALLVEFGEPAAAYEPFDPLWLLADEAGV